MMPLPPWPWSPYCVHGSLPGSIRLYRGGWPRHWLLAKAFQAFSKPSKPSRKVIERTHVHLIRIHHLLRTVASLTGEMDFIETNGQNSSLGESLPKPSRLLKPSQKQSTCTLCAFLI